MTFSSPLTESVARQLPGASLADREAEARRVVEEGRRAVQRKIEEVRKCLCQPFEFSASCNQAARDSAITISVPQAGVGAACIIRPNDAVEELLKATTMRMAQVLVDVLCVGLPEHWTLDEVFQGAVPLLHGAQLEAECATFIPPALLSSSAPFYSAPCVGQQLPPS